MAGVADASKPGWLLRLALRAPVWLYRARLGWLQKSPDVEVQLGARRRAARAEELPLDEAVRVLERYAERHPGSFRAIGKLVIGQRLEPTAADCRRLAERAPVVALRPSG
jgi:hypothetical protein